MMLFRDRTDAVDVPGGAAHGGPSLAQTADSKLTAEDAEDAEESHRDVTNMALGFHLGVLGALGG